MNDKTRNGTSFSVEVQATLPRRFERLGELGNDLYYSWNRSVRRLFRHLDPECWDASDHNPRVFLRRMRQDRINQAAQDPILLTEYRQTLSGYDTYMEQMPSMRLEQLIDPKADLVAYFSAEYGFHESMPIYAGGLGILAADYCKAMSNLWVPFVGIGILYRHGYFTQRFDCNGNQIATYRRSDPCDLPVTPALDSNGEEVKVRVDLPGRSLVLRVWEARAGHIRLLLLDSDVEDNSPTDRELTAQLYGGYRETRIQQEIILGIGGVRALRALQLQPTVWHINEGHAAFQILERCHEQVMSGLDFPSALELVAAATAFTTHTPVTAGHDVFDHGMMRNFFGNTANDLGISESQFLALGANPRDPNGFCTTSLAVRGSRFRNGVSRIHGGIAAEMESYVWPEIQVAENPMGYITNGADVDSYLAGSWVALFEMYMGGGWRAKLTDTRFWDSFIDQIPDHVFLSVRQLLKAAAIEEIRERALQQYERCARTKSLSSLLTANLTPRNINTLLIGFARRFATYKRAGLIFRDLERLARLVNDPQRPVTLVFAGKAHPNDQPGQALLRRIFEISLLPEFQGRVILLENYNLSLTRDFLPGVDVWLNTPEYPMEACGTSGMKAAINGAINLSVTDGWWAEAWNGENGWSITPHPEFDHETREQVEAMELMNILEYQVIPAYYRHNGEGYSDEWLRIARASMKTILPRFNTIRMAMDYLAQSYSPAAREGRRLGANAAEGARDLATWKQQVARAWPAVRGQLVSPVPATIQSGEMLSFEVALQLNGLQPDDIVVECVLGQIDKDDNFETTHKRLFYISGTHADGATLFRCDLFDVENACSAGGLQQFKIRYYPCHHQLSHPLECGLMRWL
ncbi:MAG TPA: alpha-glucan family phosphorylase [Gammaproteobacteria bacterium]|nr:alpha-glucan family phosphorylase [Gammaproteobacteria bacterium]